MPRSSSQVKDATLSRWRSWDRSPSGVPEMNRPPQWRRAWFLAESTVQAFENRINPVCPLTLNSYLQSTSRPIITGHRWPCSRRGKPGIGDGIVSSNIGMCRCTWNWGNVPLPVAPIMPCGSSSSTNCIFRAIAISTTVRDAPVSSKPKNVRSPICTPIGGPASRIYVGSKVYSTAPVTC